MQVRTLRETPMRGALLIQIMACRRILYLQKLFSASKLQEYPIRMLEKASQQ